MESFFSSLKTERTARKVYRSRDEAKADVFDYVEQSETPALDDRLYESPWSSRGRLDWLKQVSTEPGAAQPLLSMSPS
jgi:transposase InsO family protein